MKTNRIFGLASDVRLESYIDRGGLDAEVKKYLDRDTHIALNGASKCGKSWLRQTAIPDGNVVQVQLNWKVTDIYVAALANLGIRLKIHEMDKTSFCGTLQASGEMGVNLLAKVAGNLQIEANTERSVSYMDLKYDINNLASIAKLLRSSEKRLIIEDFHYLSNEERRKFAFGLKTLWDLGCFVVIVGVWVEQNLLTHLNGDLTGRITELSILWNDQDLLAVIDKGCPQLNIDLSDSIKQQLVNDSFGNVGILQQLLLNLIEDQAGIEATQQSKVVIEDEELYHKATSQYADQLNGLYHQFAKKVSAGIRKTADSTGIYARAMEAIVEASDEDLIKGLSRNTIFDKAHKRQPRIQAANLKSIMNKLVDLQVDDGNRNLVIAYDESTECVYIVDRQLLFYRKYLNIKWPWEDLAKEFDKDRELPGQTILLP